MKKFVTQRLTRRVLWVLAAGVLSFVVYGWRSTLAPVDAPSAASFTGDTIRRGAQLAALGDCANCHTAPGGEAFAGGRPLLTPFGTIYSTNITPDITTGIGHWSQEAFQRAMREGVNRAGEHLYPAFPYDHFTWLTDADCAALYAFIMTRQAVQAKPPDNDLPFPLNIRFILAGWKLLFLREGPYEPDPKHDEQWNRGAYLANGIGHCGACHTPRNSFGATIRTQLFDGGEAEGWHAYAINSASQSQEAWNAGSLHAFLRNGWHAQHGIAQGPMTPVTQNLAGVANDDVLAIATYVASVMGKPREKQLVKNAAAGAETRSNETGAQIYAYTCASCHDGTRPLPFGGVKLSLSTAVSGESATNLINVILAGLHPSEGTTGAIMPGFSTSLTDGQVESLVAYIRSNFAGKPPWTNLENSVREARSRNSD